MFSMGREVDGHVHLDPSSHAGLTLRATRTISRGYSAVGVEEALPSSKDRFESESESPPSLSSLGAVSCDPLLGMATRRPDWSKPRLQCKKRITKENADQKETIWAHASDSPSLNLRALRWKFAGVTIGWHQLLLRSWAGARS